MGLSSNFRKPFGNPASYPPAASDDIIRALLLRTGTESVVFKHQFPPRFPIAGLTRFGGRPIAPPDFVWPRSPNRTPYTFMAQVACPEIPDFKFRSLLPADGVLHFFTNWDVFDGLEEAETWPGHVVHSRGDTRSWREAAPPADLPPCYGLAAASHYFPWLAHTDRRVRDYPTAFPQRAMTMGVVRTFSEEHPKEVDGNSAGRYQEIWEEEQAAALRRVYGDPVGLAEFPGPERDFSEKPSVQRPTATFPAAWIDVEIFCGLFLARLIEEGMRTLARGEDATGRAWPPDPARVRAGYEAAIVECRSRIATARARGLTTRVPDADRASFWHWLDGLNAAAVDPISDDRAAYTLHRFLWQAVRTSGHIFLAAGEEPASLVPAELMGELRMEHSVLVAGRFPRRAGRHQMFGNGRNVQGAPDRHADEVLLMQLDTDYPLQWMLGDCGVLQYWIAWEDLEARCFNRVRITLEGH